MDSSAGDQILQGSSSKPSSEQVEIAATLRKFLEDRVTQSYLRARLDSPHVSDPLIWTGLEELGVFELCADPSFGMQGLALLAAEVGRSLLGETIIDSLLIGPASYHWAKSPAAREWVAKLVSTSNRSLILAPINLNLQTQPSIRLSAVLPEQAVVCCCLASTNNHPAEFKLIALSPAEVSKFSRKMGVDLSRDFCRADRADLSLANAVTVTGNSLMSCEAVLRSAEMEGAARKAFELTVEYSKVRKQFGREIGSFQAVQHALSDMYAQLESVRSIVNFAAWSIDTGASQCDAVSQAALRLSCNKLEQVVEKAVQLHGGIGFTWEYDLHLYMRRVRSLVALYGETNENATNFLEQLC